MKITLVIEHFDSTRGGAEHFTVWLAHQLAAGGQEVHIVCHDTAAKVNKYRQATQRASHDADRSHQAHPPEEVFHDGIYIHRLRGMKLNSGFGFRLFGRRAQRWCENHPAGIVHSMSVAFPGDIYHPHAGVYAEIQAQAVASRSTEAQAKWKQLMLRLSGKQRTLLALEKRAVRNCERGMAAGAGRSSAGPLRIISLCAMMTEQLRRHYGIDGAGGEGGGQGGPIVELPNPRMGAAGSLDAAGQKEAREWFRGHYRLAPQDKVAVFVGHDFRRKGLRYAIEAVARTRDWKLLVVGLGKAREYVEFADSLGIGDNKAREGGGRRILFVGPTKEMEKVYAASDALVLPTFYDSFGLVVLEALSHGLPVISTEHLGAGYLVKQHDAGTIVASPRDVAAIAQALESLPAAESAEGRSLSARAREASRGMLPEEYMKRMLALYDQVRAQIAAHGRAP